jgi:electron transfer flavoprotein alpha subunit
MSVLVFIEQRDGKVRPGSLEALGEGHRLAKQLGGEVIGVCPAAADPGLAALGSAGADKIILAAHDSFARYDAAGYAKAVAAAAESAKPAAILFAASSMGKDLAPRVAARLNVGLAGDCTSIAAEGGKLVASRPVYAGKAIQKVSFPNAPAALTLRPKAFAPETGTGRGGAVERVDASPDPSRARVVEVTAAAAGKLDLTEAEIIVSGGRGMKGPENFKLIEELADALGATVGASRAVVDAGWRPHSDQVGQTGKTVSPKLYIAVGISGAIQHLAGMSSSRCIVAINKDADAPIFKVADYGLVGDLFEIVPVLTEAVKKLHAHA